MKLEESGAAFGVAGGGDEGATDGGGGGGVNWVSVGGVVLSPALGPKNLIMGALATCMVILVSRVCM